MRKLILCRFTKLLVVNKIKLLYEENSFAYHKFVINLLKKISKGDDEKHFDCVCGRNVFNEDR